MGAGVTNTKRLVKPKAGSTLILLRAFFKGSKGTRFKIRPWWTLSNSHVCTSSLRFSKTQDTGVHYCFWKGYSVLVQIIRAQICRFAQRAQQARIESDLNWWMWRSHSFVFTVFVSFLKNTKSILPWSCALPCTTISTSPVRWIWDEDEM